jgi:uncharacterized protein YoxC
VLEVLKICANWGFPAVLCIYLLSVLPKFGKTLDRLDNAIENHLTHALESNTEATKKNSDSGERIERAINNLSERILNFINK